MSRTQTVRSGLQRRHRLLAAPMAALLAAVLGASPVLGITEYTGTVTISSAVTDANSFSVGSTTTTATGDVTVGTGGSLSVTATSGSQGIAVGYFAGSNGNKLTVEGTGTVTVPSLRLGYVAGSTGNSVLFRAGGKVTLNSSCSPTYIDFNDNSITITGTGSKLELVTGIYGTIIGGNSNTITVPAGGTWTPGPRLYVGDSVTQGAGTSIVLTGTGSKVVASSVVISPGARTAISLTGSGSSILVSAGGTLITINGTGFQAGATVKVGEASCTNVTVVSPTQLTCTTPPGRDAKQVVVTNPDDQRATARYAFTYISPTPTPTPTPSPTPRPTATPAPTMPPPPYTSTGSTGVSSSPTLNSILAGREATLLFQAESGSATVSDLAVVRSLTTEDGCVSPTSVADAKAVLPADYGLTSLAWDATKSSFSIHWLAPAAKGITASVVVTLADGTRIVACYLSK